MASKSRPSPSTREALPAEAQHRLIAVRGAVILGEALMVLLLAFLLDARLPWAALGGILLLHLILNAAAWMRLCQGGPGLLELSLHLATDAIAIAALVFLTGGYANPSISLLLVPLILAAVTLPGTHAWVMAAWVGLLYTMLMRYYHPLETRISATAAVDLHLAGMWLNFLLTAALVAAFAGHLAAALRRRDAELAEVREQRLRDEQLFALGLQAAAAAHDLATPMASVRLTLDELRHDYAGDDELEGPLSVLSAQLARMEAVLARLAAAAQGRERTAGPPLPVGKWLRRMLERWGLMWPRARVDLDLAEPLGDIEDGVALEAVLITLLNNAARASPAALTLAATRQGDRLLLTVADRGPGLAAGAGQPGGWGVGLELAEATLARLGGRLRLEDAPGGGAVARLEWPLAAGDAAP
jgi:two-component system sensor histidine kinase RegB